MKKITKKFMLITIMAVFCATVAGILGTSIVANANAAEVVIFDCELYDTAIDSYNKNIVVDVELDEYIEQPECGQSEISTPIFTSNVNEYGGLLELHQATRTTNLITIVIIADRYTFAQQEDFFITAQAQANFIVNSHPINEFKPWIQIWAIGTFSPTQDLSVIVGGGSDGLGTSAVTINNTRRFVQENPQAQNNPRFSTALPSNSNDIFWIVTQRGRTVSPRGYAQPDVGLAVSNESFGTALHELGHLWGLSDEYSLSQSGGHINGPNLRTNVDLNNPTEGFLTHNPTDYTANTAITPQWALFIGDTAGQSDQWQGVGGIGIYQIYPPDFSQHITFFRPSQHCIMIDSQFHGAFCLVCAEHLAHRFISNRIDNTIIRSYANSRWRGHVHITIPLEVTKIGDYAFIKNTELRTIINRNSSPQAINSTTFHGANRANITLAIPAGTRQAYINAGWTGFNYLELQNDAVIGFTPAADFNGNLIIPQGVTGINANGLANQIRITNIQLPPLFTHVGQNAFVGTAWWNAQPNDSVVILDEWVVGVKGQLPNTVTLPNNIVGIADNAFSNANTSFQNLIVPARFTDDFGFAVPSVHYVGQNAFNRSGIPLEVTIYGWLAAPGSFHFNFAGNASVLFKHLGFEVNNDGVLLRYTGNEQNLVIPDGQITQIGANAFAGNTTLHSVMIPQSVWSIGDNAFSGATKLMEVFVPLREIVLSNGVMHTPPQLGSNVFSNLNPGFVITVPDFKKSEYTILPSWNQYRDIIVYKSTIGINGNFEGEAVFNNNSARVWVRSDVELGGSMIVHFDLDITQFDVVVIRSSDSDTMTSPHFMTGAKPQITITALHKTVYWVQVDITCWSGTVFNGTVPVRIMPTNSQNSFAVNLPFTTPNLPLAQRVRITEHIFDDAPVSATRNMLIPFTPANSGRHTFEFITVGSIQNIYFTTIRLLSFDSDVDVTFNANASNMINFVFNHDLIAGHTYYMVVSARRYSLNVSSWFVNARVDFNMPFIGSGTTVLDSQFWNGSLFLEVRFSCPGSGVPSKTMLLHFAGISLVGHRIRITNHNNNVIAYDRTPSLRFDNGGNSFVDDRILFSVLSGGAIHTIRITPPAGTSGVGTVTAQMRFDRTSGIEQNHNRRYSNGGAVRWDFNSSNVSGNFLLVSFLYIPSVSRSDFRMSFTGVSDIQVITITTFDGVPILNASGNLPGFFPLTAGEKYVVLFAVMTSNNNPSFGMRSG